MADLKIQVLHTGRRTATKEVSLVNIKKNLVKLLQEFTLISDYALEFCMQDYIVALPGQWTSYGYQGVSFFPHFRN